MQRYKLSHTVHFIVTFAEPHGAYCLTPLYDILSAHPLLLKKQLEKQKIKLAMALLLA